MRGDDHDGIVTHGRSKEFRMHMKNPAQTGSYATPSEHYVDNPLFVRTSVSTSLCRQSTMCQNLSEQYVDNPLCQNLSKHYGDKPCLLCRQTTFVRKASI